MSQRRVVQIPDDDTSFPVFVDAADDVVAPSFEATVIESSTVFETLELRTLFAVPIALSSGRRVRITPLS